MVINLPETQRLHAGRTAGNVELGPIASTEIYEMRRIRDGVDRPTQNDGPLRSTVHCAKLHVRNRNIDRLNGNLLMLFIARPPIEGSTSEHGNICTAEVILRAQNML